MSHAAAFGRPLLFRYTAAQMTTRKDNIILIGPMGSRNTAFGKQLARLNLAPYGDRAAEERHECPAYHRLYCKKEERAEKDSARVRQIEHPFFPKHLERIS